MITLINPPNPPTGVSNKDMMGGFGQLYLKDKTEPCKVAPIDIPYIASILRENGFQINIIDCLGMNYGPKKLLEKLKIIKPEIVGLRTSTPTWKWDLKIVSQIKEAINCKLVLFGPHVSLFFKEIAKVNNIDAFIIGEPEFTFLDIAKKRGFEGINGVHFKHNSTYKTNPSRPFIENLDDLPWPAWDLMPYENYDPGELGHNRKPFLTILTSRGCPFQCHYCPYPVAQGSKWRNRSVKNVVDEIGYLFDNFKLQYLLFRDAEFTLHKDRAAEICRGIIERGIKIAWRCETRIDTLDEELIDLMAKAGCIGINMGIESVDESIIRKVGRKPVNKNYAIQTVSKCKEVCIETFCFFIIGLPGDNKKSILNTIDFILELDPLYAQFTVATPYPGTKLRKWTIDNGYLENDSVDELTGYNAVMRNENLTINDIQQLYLHACRIWRFGKRGRKIRVIKKGPFQGIKEIIKMILFLFERLRIKFILKG